jgi:hypothetical protein
VLDEDDRRTLGCAWRIAAPPTPVLAEWFIRGVKPPRDSRGGALREPAERRFPALEPLSSHALVARTRSGVVAQSLVRPRFIEVASVFIEHLLQVELVVHEHVVKAFAA